MTAAQIAIRALITAAELELQGHRARRDTPGLSDFDRVGAGIDAAACALRINAYRRCLRIVEQSP